MKPKISQLRTVDGETLMSQPLHPPDFVVNGLLSRGCISWRAPLRWGSPGWPSGWQ